MPRKATTIDVDPIFIACESFVTNSDGIPIAVHVGDRLTASTGLPDRFPQFFRPDGTSNYDLGQARLALLRLPEVEPPPPEAPPARPMRAKENFLAVAIVPPGMAANVLVAKGAVHDASVDPIPAKYPEYFEPVDGN